MQIRTQFFPRFVHRLTVTWNRNRIHFFGMLFCLTVLPNQRQGCNWMCEIADWKEKKKPNIIWTFDTWTWTHKKENVNIIIASYCSYTTHFRSYRWCTNIFWSRQNRWSKEKKQKNNELTEFSTIFTYTIRKIKWLNNFINSNVCMCVLYVCCGCCCWYYYCCCLFIYFISLALC